VNIMTRAAVAIALVTVGLAGAARAEHTGMSLPLAKQVAGAAAAEAKRLSAPGGAIAVVDGGGHLVYLERLDRTFPAAAVVATEKARTAAVFQRPTADFENAIKGGRHSLLGVSVMTPLQGGVPIRAGGELVGAVGVSGAASAQQDEDIAKAAAASIE
jgi:glc operon protein GlcG